ncbi:MAG: rRNA maturation RNase YbeY [Cyanobacteria bacterium]|nr:rRNA maturation RNase YbeY [Cyanobacteriota bacterium]MDA0866771.1 rRNA maturation RNase YbeY [Cyanobacteriota bacterium]
MSVEKLQRKVEVSLQGDALEHIDDLAPLAQWEQWLRCWLQLLNVELSPIHAYELSVQFTGDRGIQTLNQQYRDQDRPTDVLAFATLDDPIPTPAEVLAQDPLYLGDIVISVETALRQSQAHGHTLQEELLWLLAHGFLHLLGWDHPDEAALQRMWQQQQQLLQGIGVTLAASAYTQEAG